MTEIHKEDLPEAPEAPEGKIWRTCQECGHVQLCKHPRTYKDDSWRGTKCRKCRSEALDYGSITRRGR